MRLLLLSAALALAGCNQASVPTSDSATARWVDPETGCVYIVYGDGMGQSRVGSLSIRHRSDGSPDCPGSNPAQSTNETSFGG